MANVQKFVKVKNIDIKKIRFFVKINFFVSNFTSFKYFSIYFYFYCCLSVVLSKVSLNSSEFECSLLSSYLEPTVPSA